MLLFIIALFSKVIRSEDTQCIAYSFTEDLYRKFSSKGCDTSTSWNLVSYEDIGVIPPDEKSLSGLKTTEQSCMSSFPVSLSFSGNIQVTILAENCGVQSKCVKKVQIL